MTDPTKYPVAAAFEKELGELSLLSLGREIGRRMLTHIREYEVGAGEPQELLPAGKSALAAISSDPDFIRRVQKEFALETMSAVYLDFLRTYWTDQSPRVDITVFQTPAGTDGDDLKKIGDAVKAAGGEMLAFDDGTVFAVSALRFTGSEATAAFFAQTGLDSTDWESPLTWIDPTEE